MTTPRRSSLTRFFALLLTFGLVAAGCGSDDNQDDDIADPGDTPEPTTEILDEDVPDGGEPDGGEPVAAPADCENFTDDDSALSAVIARLCTLGLSDAELDRFQVQECPDPNLTPRVFYNIDEGEPSLALFMHMMVRFHPVDELNDGPPGATTYRPADDYQLDLPEGHKVWVLDTGAHGEFASLVIAEMLQVDPGTISRVDWSAQSNALSGAVDPDASIVSINLPDRAPVEGLGLLTTEADVVAVLSAVLADEGIDKSKLVINMSFGAYNCGQPPQALKTVIEGLAEAGTQIVASAGNDETSERLWPAGWADDRDLGDHVTSVGSVVTDDDVRSCFSNYGSHVETWMHGEEVVTDMGQWSGTSFAAPQITALIASGQTPTDLHRSAPADPPSMEPFELAVGTETVERQTYCTKTSGYGPQGAEY